MLIKITRSNGQKITFPEKSLILIEEDPARPGIIFIQYFNGMLSKSEHIASDALELIKE